MNTINIAAAPQAPEHVANIWQLEQSSGTFLKFKFKDSWAAEAMLKEVTLDPLVTAVHRHDKEISVHYVDRFTMQHSAKAISKAYNIELI